MDEATKKTVLRLFPYGLYAVTASDGELTSGMTANWLSQVSFEPPQVVVAVENDARTLGLIRRAGRFAACHPSTFAAQHFRRVEHPAGQPAAEFWGRWNRPVAD